MALPLKAGGIGLGIGEQHVDIHELITRICEHAPGFTGSPAMDMMYDMFNDLQRTVDTADHGDQMLWCVRKVREL